MRYWLNGDERVIVCSVCEKSLGGRDEPAAQASSGEYLCPQHRVKHEKLIIKPLYDE